MTAIMATTEHGPAVRWRMRAARLAFSALALLLLLLAAPAPVPAQQMLFSRLGSEQGLSQGAVLAIQQDDKGFIWIGTEDGLDRYDGYELQHLVRDRKAARSLPNNWVSAMALGADGRLFIGTDGGGVVWRDPQTGAFRAPYTAAGRPMLDPQAHVRTLRFDRQGRLWVGTRDSGLILANLATGDARSLRHDESNPATLSHDSVFDVVEDGDGSIWVATQAGLDRVTATGAIERWGERLRTVAQAPSAVAVNALRIDDRGSLWIGTDVGLFRRDPASGQLTLMRHAAGNPNSLPDDRVTAILQDIDLRLWIGTAGGLALLDRRSDEFSAFRSDPADPASLPENYVVSLFQDASGLLWIGTKSAGMARWNPRSWSFGHHRGAAGASNNIASFAEDSRGTLWVGSYGGGLSAIDPRSGAATHYGRNAQGVDIGDDNVMAVVVDARDRIWIGTMRAGVTRLDRRTGRVDRFTYRPDDPASLGAPGIMALTLDSHGNVWVGTFGGGLARIDGKRDVVQRFAMRGTSAGGLAADRATAIAEDRSGLIWVGTDGAGLDVLDPVSGTFRNYVHSPVDPASLSANTVYALHVDNLGQVWVGTRGGGLDRAIGAPLSQRGLTFENFSENEGLPNSTVYGIESENNGQLWLSTNRGLSRFDRKARKFLSFRRSHGLQGDEFNFGAHYHSPSGQLFFGGANGWNAFFPDALRFDDRPPPVAITEILKFNEPLQTGRLYERIDNLAMRYQDDVLTFRFAALDFTAPAENRYAYKLEGFDADWVDAGSNRQATYTNLDGGHYVFRVRAANSDGAWNEQGAAISLTVKPPPWKTWWANILYVLAFASMLFAVWAGQQRKLKREEAYKRRLQDEVTARTAELALRNDQLEKANTQLHEASFTDPLTGLGNRRALQDGVKAVLATAVQEPAGGSGAAKFIMMIVDLDRLKPINDQHGHEAGDRVLTQIAEILRQASRSTDKVVRWGGDEFVLLCRNADMTAATQLAERVRSAVAKQIFRIGDGLVARTSCSVGFAPYPFIPQAPDHLDWEQSLAMADAALYEAKRTRNSWVGWAGTARALDLPHLLAEVERDPATLEEGGYLEVRRRPAPTEDTVDQLRAYTPGER
jgi:diguanylate cyclase (GGDEF)-like protein